MRVLIADTDSKNTDNISQAFKLCIPEFNLVTTESGQKGLEIARKNGLGLAVIGTELRDMTGFELTKKIRRFSEIPIILLFDKKDDSAIEKALGIGVDQYVAKPIRQIVFIAYVRALLRRVSKSFQSEHDEHESLMSKDYLLMK